MLGAAIFGTIYAFSSWSGARGEDALFIASINAALLLPPWSWIAEHAPERSDDSGYYYDDDFSSHEMPAINPATGLPMCGPGTCGVDAGGHVYGSSD